MINETNRKKILDLILNLKSVFEFANNRDEGVISFLNEIWDLKSMPSEDNRFSNAEQDIIQHTINNDDWSWHELFEKRLKLTQYEDKFTRFLEVFLLPKYQNNLEDVHYFVERINDVLDSQGLTLAIVSYEDDFPILELTRTDALDQPNDIPINKIPFFVLPYPNMSVDKFVSKLKVDKEKPTQHFLLVTDNWDDYDHKTTFQLVYFDNGEKTALGDVKIGSNKDIITVDILPVEFFI